MVEDPLMHLNVVFLIIYISIYTIIILYFPYISLNLKNNLINIYHGCVRLSGSLIIIEA